MPTEYQSLTLMTLFFTIAWFPVSVGKKQAFGIKWLASNRSPSADGQLPEWAARCERAYSNLKDYFPAFVVAVLTLGALGKFDGSTQCAAMIFLTSRLLHYVSYGFGNVPGRFLGFIGGISSNIYLLVKILA